LFSFTAELVCPAAIPPTAFSTMARTFSGDRGSVQQMLAEDLDLLCGAELAAAVGWFVLLVVAHVLFRSGKVSWLTIGKRTGKGHFD
jgi:hypothetical protein